MKFFDRWKKRSFEEKMDDLSQTVLTENNIKDPKQVEQYVVERLEQMIDITREIEEEIADENDFTTIRSLTFQKKDGATVTVSVEYKEASGWNKFGAA